MQDLTLKPTPDSGHCAHVAFISDTGPLRQIFAYICEAAQPPRIRPAREPPGWDDPLAEAIATWAAVVQRQREDVFDQQVQW